jgi:uncharacterized protein (TIGR03437 family)
MRKTTRDARLDAYFAAVHSSHLRQRVANWRLYAAVTGSTMAMLTGASAAVIQTGIADTSEPPASARVASQHLLSSGNTPLRNVIRQAIANAKASPQTAPQTTQAQAQAPAILPNGVVPLYSTSTTIQSGEWVSIYGSNLASQTTLWNNDFPISLGGTSVTINGQSAYLLFVSPGQINLQAPDDSATGTVTVVVTTAAGSATSMVTLGQASPSFSLLDSKHVAGIILRDNGSGAYGNGTYDILGPTGTTLGYPTVAAKPGDSVVLFGFGFGPTTPHVPAGQVYSGQARMANDLSLYIANGQVKNTFAGISSAGLYQINLRIPNGLGNGDVPLQAMTIGLSSQPGVVISLDDPSANGGGPVFSGGGGTAPPPPFVSSPGFFSSFPGGSSGGFGGGSSGGFGGGSGGGGGSSNARRRHRRYEPTMKFPPKKQG